jgi:hypothetical protein
LNLLALIRSGTTDHEAGHHLLDCGKFYSYVFHKIHLDKINLEKKKTVKEMCVLFVFQSLAIIHRAPSPGSLKIETKKEKENKTQTCCRLLRKKKRKKRSIESVFFLFLLFLLSIP